MINWKSVPTPSYVVIEELLIKNLEKLKFVQDATNCKILLAQKGFSMFYTYPLISKYLYGTSASSLFELKLGYDEMKGENHIFCPAYIDDEIDEIIALSDHMVFNSFTQWNKFKDKVLSSKKVSCGMRVNPEYSEIQKEIYNPCAKGSRLGVKLNVFENQDLSGLDGIHFHTMCEQNSDTLERTLEVFEEKFGKYLYSMKWLNLGGGHHITREDYDSDKLINCINKLKDKYDLEIYLEPGDAIALNTGFLVSKVIDKVENQINICIMDTSAACHMPDVLEMPYRAEIIGANKPNVDKYTYRLAGPTCLAGDIIGDYSFPEELNIDDRVVFCDMAHYTMVKNNTFNGFNLPNICYYSNNEGLKIVKSFNYNDFKGRLS